jgi:hypothetical protein
MLRPSPVPLPTSLVVKKRLEDARQHIGRDAGAGVADLDHRVVAGRQLGVTGDVIGVEVTVCRRDHQAPAARHRVAGVGGEVDEAGLELRRVGADGPDIGGEVERDRDVLAERPREQPGDPRHHLVERDRPGLQGLAAGKG